ncbi:DUF4019 domain-containing protein [Parasphingopyxis marina]|uniref:DUF4019 domain-containing protein n=1 Tax=Parasphingopyxis marina TaxID=2761622 RepID=A0A842HY07_9SPHN|nr:DUF4019 domain-containing protein [Parasphingopyxis marina]MBC2777317.1 DUF4019 domain-containing protein [Parasphingopyxis marina]
MRHLIAGFALLLLAACSLAADADAGREAVTIFHDQFDDREFAAIYREADSALQDSVSEADFIAQLGAFRERMGTVESTEEGGWNSQSATSGRQVELNQETRFQNGTADERFIFRFEGDVPRLAGYHFNTTEFTGEEPGSTPPPEAAGK